MTVLTDADMLDWMAHEELIIDPLSDDNLQPASYDLTLGSNWIVPRPQTDPNPINPFRDSQTAQNTREIQSDSFVINSIQRPNAHGSSPQSGPFVLGHVQEHIEIPDTLTAFVKGRSSIGRLGILPHTAGWVDPGFAGTLTLEFVNLSPNPIVLEAGERIAQIVFVETASPVLESYHDKADNKYYNQSGVTNSRM